jgi:hypothetical protein
LARLLYCTLRNRDIYTAQSVMFRRRALAGQEREGRWCATTKKGILGAVAVPVVAQAKLLAPASSIGAPSNECVIKGNVNRKHELIYHLPGQLKYAQTRMDKGSGERCFCTKAEAQAAGWRKAGR